LWHGWGVHLATMAQTSIPRPYIFPHADRRGRVAFQGRFGAYSHMACQQCYPRHTAVPHDNFDGAFAAVANGDCDLAMIPIQNSTGGRVADIHQLLPKTNLFIIAEHFQKIQHCWLAADDADPKKIKYIYSHPQALAQCKKNIAARGLTPIEFHDTAGAAAMVAEKNNGEMSALAAEICADIYGLKIIERNLEDSDNNITRFIVLSKNEIMPDTAQDNVVSAMIFSTKSIPAALYKCLGGFASNNINLLKLESYIPMLAGGGVAEFYIEFAGTPQQPAVQHALEELSYFTTMVRPLGSFVKNHP
ncbi:MAG: prephenate dehydratase domain-containing protein, partial [Hydrotalea sp.]|nr:prephenate dehydratase domain-containing protein [Hydrotalea sp.]